MLSESSDEDDDDGEEKEMSKVKEELQPIEPAKQPQLFVMGFLQELRIFLSNTVGGVPVEVMDRSSIGTFKYVN